MDPELESVLDRADELLSDLEDEYNNCLQAQNVTERARNLTDEVLQKLRNALDQTMSRAWGKYIGPKLSEEDRTGARVYFPIAGDPHSFRSIPARGYMADLDRVHKRLYDFLLKQQPFSSEENRWLDLLAKIAAKGKHVRLTPQKRTETRRIKVSRPEGGSASWTPSSVNFGGRVTVMGAPVDPRTQRIVSTPGVTEQVQIWVSFIFEGYGVNALGFCREAYQKTRALIEEMVNVLQL
ncbi:MAG: hypothetical protein ACE5JL_17080 [Dehalococcoidia bacterium]